MPGSRLEIFEGVGHFPQSEAPKRLVEVVSDFVDSTPAAQLTEIARQARGGGAL